MHQRVAYDAHGRSRASAAPPEAHGARQVVGAEAHGGASDEAVGSRAQEVMTKRSQRSLKRALRWLGRSSSCISAAFMMPTDAPEQWLPQPKLMKPNKSSAPSDLGGWRWSPEKQGSRGHDKGSPEPPSPRS